MNGIHEGDDLWYALEYNHPEKFKPEDIADIVAEVPGENDELSWWWILRLNDGRFVLLEASCDYTGWDCQSGIDLEAIYDTALECVMFAPEQDSSGRKIRPNLLRQIQGQNPLFTYIEPED